MMGWKVLQRRRWGQFPRRLRDELNATNGIVGAIGFLFFLVPLLIHQGMATNFLAILGGTIGLAALATPVWNAIPPPLVRPDSLQGRRVALSRLNEISPEPIRLAIVGLSQAGKSTLIDRLHHRKPALERTQDQHAYVIPISLSDKIFVALLDGPGGLFADQFEVASKAEFLCIMLDHASDTESQVADEGRLEASKQFCEQLRAFILTQNRRLRRVHLLLNKQDVWRAGGDKDKLNRFLEHERYLWERSNLAKRSTARRHSNFAPDNVAELMDEIRKYAEEL